MGPTHGYRIFEIKFQVAKPLFDPQTTGIWPKELLKISFALCYILLGCFIWPLCRRMICIHQEKKSISFLQVRETTQSQIDIIFHFVTIYISIFSICLSICLYIYLCKLEEPRTHIQTLFFICIESIYLSFLFGQLYIYPSIYNLSIYLSK